MSVNFTGNTSGLTSAVKSAKGAIGMLADNPLGAVGLGLGAVAVAAVGFGIASTKMAGDYQQAMDMVRALTGSSTDQMAKYDAGLKQLATDAGVAPTQLASGLYNVLSASYRGADAMKVLTLATEDSKIGMTSASVTTDALTNVLRSFGVQSQDITRVNGEMLETVTLGKSTFEQYASVIVKSSSAAVQFHVSMETMNAAWSTMTSSGIRAAQASTDFQSSLKVMYGNIGTVTASLHKNGIAFDEAKFNTMSYGDKVVYLNKALQEANDKHVKVTGVTLQAAQAISTISNHIGDYNNNLATLSDRQAMAQKTAQAWAITQAGFNETIDRLKASLDVVMINIGSKLLPILTSIGQFIQPIVQAFGDWIANSNGLGGALSPLNAIFQPLFQTIKSFDPTGLVYAFKNVGSAISGIFSPLNNLKNTLGGLDLGKIGKELQVGFLQATFQLSNALNGLAGYIRSLQPTFQQISDIIGGVFSNHMKTAASVTQDLGKWFQSSLMPAVKQALPGFESLANTLITVVIPGLVKLWAIGQSVIDKVLPPLTKVFETAVPVIIRFAGVISGGLSQALKFLMPYIIQAAQALAQFAGDIATRVAPILENFFTSLDQGLTIFLQIWNVVWPYLGPILKGVWDEIVGVIKIAWALVSGIIKIGLDILSGNWSQAWTDFKDMLKGVWDGIKQILKGAWEIIAGWAGAAWALIANAIKGPMNAIGGFFSGLWNGIKNTASTVWHAITSTIMGIVNGVVTWLTDTWQNAVNTVVGWFNWLYDHNYYFKALVDTIRRVIGAVVTWLTDTWRNVTGWISHEWAYLTMLAEIKWAMVQFIIQSKIRQVEQFVHNILLAIGNFFIDRWNDLVAKTTSLWDRIKTVFSSAWNRYIAGPLGSLWNSISGWINARINDFTNFGKNIINAIVNGIKSVAGNVGNTLHNVIGGALSGLGFHGIPGFASGVTNFRGGWAVVGEGGPELVNLPSGSNVYQSGMGPNGGNHSSSSVNDSGNQTIIFQLDSTELARITGDRQARMVRLKMGRRSA